MSNFTDEDWGQLGRGEQDVNPAWVYPGYVEVGRTGRDAQGRTRGDYQRWWDNEKLFWDYYDLSNPTIRYYIASRAWAGTPDTNIMIGLEQMGITPRGGSRQGGGGGGGGGGYGGISKEEQYAQAAAEIRDIAANLGANLDDAGINALAKVVVDDSWSQSMIFDYMVPGVLAMETIGTGQIRDNIALIKQLGFEYMLTVSEDTAKEMAGKIAKGETTLESVKTLFQEQAQVQYGFLSSQLQKGFTMRELTSFARDRIANELELSPAQIDMMDPKYQSMYMVTDEKTNQQRLATDAEIIKAARGTSEWSNTNKAVRQTADYAMMIREYLGG